MKKEEEDREGNLSSYPDHRSKHNPIETKFL